MVETAESRARPGGLLRRVIDRIALSEDEQEDTELTLDAERAGCQAIASYDDRDMVTVHGRLRAVTLRPRGGVSALEAELSDGTGTVTVIWLGRRRIAGIECGREMTVTGRLSQADGMRVIYNPRYELTA